MKMAEKNEEVSSSVDDVNQEKAINPEQEIEGPIDINVQGTDDKVFDWSKDLPKDDSHADSLDSWGNKKGGSLDSWGVPKPKPASLSQDTAALVIDLVDSPDGEDARSSDGDLSQGRGVTKWSQSSQLDGSDMDVDFQEPGTSSQNISGPKTIASRVVSRRLSKNTARKSTGVVKVKRTPTHLDRIDEAYERVSRSSYSIRSILMMLDAEFCKLEESLKLLKGLFSKL